MSNNEAKLMGDILGCYVSLSPENVWCDGEASPAQARATERRVRAELKRLFQALGREVSEQEACNYWSKR